MESNIVSNFLWSNFEVFLKQKLLTNWKRKLTYIRHRCLILQIIKKYKGNERIFVSNESLIFWLLILSHLSSDFYYWDRIWRNMILKMSKNLLSWWYVIHITNEKSEKKYVRIYYSWRKLALNDLPPQLMFFKEIFYSTVKTIRKF